MCQVSSGMGEKKKARRQTNKLKGQIVHTLHHQENRGGSKLCVGSTLSGIFQLYCVFTRSRGTLEIKLVHHTGNRFPTTVSDWGGDRELIEWVESNGRKESSFWLLQLAACVN